MKSSLAIGDAAARFALPAHVLRHWEGVGLLRPERDAGGRRRYGEDDLVRIGVIVRNRSAGMSLEQIASLLDERAPGRHRVLEDHLADLERRMADMERSRRMTQHALRCRAHDITTCARFRAVMDDVVAGTGPWREAEPSAAHEAARHAATADAASTDPAGDRRGAASAR